MAHLYQAFIVLALLGTSLQLAAADGGPPDQSITQDGAVEMGLAAQHPGDLGITADPKVIYASDFENGIQAPLEIARKGVSVIEDPDYARSGRRFAQIVATRGKDEGGDLKIHWKEGVDHCFLRVYVRFHRDTVMPHHFINLRGHTENYRYRWGGSAGLRPPGGSDGAFGTTIEPPKGPDGGWKFYSYWHQMHSWQTPEGEPDGRPNAFYGNNFRAADQPLTLEKDRWICVEMMIKLNPIGEHDGEQAFWIDGIKYGHWRTGSPEGTWLRDSFHSQGKWNTRPKPFEGFNWRSHPSLKVNKAQLQWYLSDRSYKNATVNENIVAFDNLVIATDYIGPIREP